MGFWSVLTSSKKVVDTMADLATSAAKGIDVLAFTDEEKSEAKQKWFSLWLEGQRIMRDENTARSITRRYLAIMIMSTFLGFLVASGIVFAFHKELSAHLFELAASMSTLALTVAIFYFGYYGVKSIVKTVKK